MNVLRIINTALSEMTKSEYKVALFASSNIGDFAFETLDSISKKIGTSTTSVLRFCHRIGFEGYKELQDSIRAELKANSSLPDKFEQAVNDADNAGLAFGICNRAQASLRRTFDELSDEVLDRAVSCLVGAERIFTFGMKESYALAHYAYTRLITVRPNVSVLPVAYNGEVEYLLSLNENDVCLVFLFHRYTGASVRILKRLKERGVRILLVSAAPYDEIAEYSDVLLPCYVDIGGIKNSSVAPVALVDCICNAAAMKLGDEALEYMRMSEAEFKNLEVLSNGENS